MVSLGASEDFIQSMTNQEMKKNACAKFYTQLSFQERGSKLARCLPFYFFLTIFRVMSFSLVLVVLRVYSFILYFGLLSILLLGVLISALRNKKDATSRALRYLRTTRREQGLVYFLVLPFRTIFSTGNTDKETAFQVFWFLCNSLLVISLSFVVFLNPHGELSKVESIYNFLDLGKVHLIKYNLAFNATVGIILLSGNLSICLYFLQIVNWKKQII